MPRPGGTGGVVSWLTLAGQLAGFAISMVNRYLDGDDSPEVMRVIDVLPAEMRADVEHERQRRLLEDELREDLGMKAEERAAELETKLLAAGFPEPRFWARAVHGLQLPPHVPIGERETPANPFGDAS